ncbi:MAG: Mobile element protein [uncultured Paraburkholderia sp.]|nr:MAG: Mobile element protein [uncultured Paraburkholderia sp.]CAH2945464.1 MAG: Mobile element protein [uncultured Paraburkholderia sp.]
MTARSVSRQADHHDHPGLDAHVLDNLLYHESELRIEEHYTNTNGFTDHLFAIFPTVG